VAELKIPQLSLVVMVGPSGSGKSTFARTHFAPTEVLSSDRCRGLVRDDENDPDATNDAFEVLHLIARKRLAAGKLTVIDATNVQVDARKALVSLAREFHCLPVAVVLALPERLCQQRNAARGDRQFGPHVVRQQTQHLRRSLRRLRDEGFRYVFVLRSPEEVAAVTIERQPLWNDRRQDHGPFDIIGDVHGCFDELRALLQRLGYAVESAPDVADGWRVRHPESRKAVFLGDLVDRGPNTPEVLRLVMSMVADGTAYCVPGNHDVKLMRKLRGRNVRVTHGLAESLSQLEQRPPALGARVADFIDGLVNHYVLDEGKLVVAHAGLPACMHGRGSGKVRDFALYGDTTGETDDYGLPVRYPWAQDYRGRAMVVYGHTPMPEPEWLNRTICIDTGCVFGGRLTALRYPERELVSVPAAATYYQPSKPFLLAHPPLPPLTAQQAHDDLLDMDDVSGKRIISTRLGGNVTIREEHATAALEMMSRFAVDPKWLIYLPPTMSPSETTTRAGMLEHPAEAFAYFRGQGVASVVCEEKHMGSRAVLVVCRDEQTGRARFGIDGGAGICFTRTGRRFFSDEALETGLLARVRAAFDAAGLWRELETDWACLDCELMPWSMKAQELLRAQYAAVGAAAVPALAAAMVALSDTAGRGGEQATALAALCERTGARAAAITRYVDAYRRYCWDVTSLADVKLAPFHLLATEGRVHADKQHAWHMNVLGALCAADDGVLRATPWRTVDLTDPASEGEAIVWWGQLTASGGEGMVVKPSTFLARGPRGLVQPAVKCRGAEYLRIIYGPEYLEAENLERLRARGLSAKRGLALREFALGIEALERFVRREPLRRVHECVFGVLALESEPVDPRL